MVGGRDAEHLAAALDLVSVEGGVARPDEVAHHFTQQRLSLLRVGQTEGSGMTFSLLGRARDGVGFRGAVGRGIKGGSAPCRNGEGQCDGECGLMHKP